MQEHPALLIQAKSRMRSYNSQMGAPDLPRHLWDYAVGRGGLLSAGVFQALAFVKTNPALSHPDIQLHFSPCGVEKDQDVFRMIKEDSIAVHPNVSRPRSLGSIELPLPILSPPWRSIFWRSLDRRPLSLLRS